MSVTSFLRRAAYSPIGPLLMLPRRCEMAGVRLLREVGRALRWLFTSREWTNFSYEYTQTGRDAAIEVLSIVTARPREEIARYATELEQDQALRDSLRRGIEAAGYRFGIDPGMGLGKRLLHYIVARATKPRVVVEAGTHLGLGAAVLRRALERNRAEGHAGKLYAVDLIEGHGQLLDRSDASIAELTIADTVAFLERLGEPVDYFIHETASDDAHERAQFAQLSKRLAPGGIVVTPWLTPRFIEFVHSQPGYGLLPIREEPARHWHGGDTMSFAFPLKR
jgi:predicted O-methyltransferase YrrM